MDSEKKQELTEVNSEAQTETKPAGFVQATKDFFGNALSTVKGKDLSVLVEEFSSEMTLVAEGLSDDQAKLHELCHQLSAQQTVDHEELKTALDRTDESIHTAEERITSLENGLKDLKKSLEQFEKKTEEKKKHKLDTLSGLIRQLTILVAVGGGAWVLVTLLNLFRR